MPLTPQTTPMYCTMGTTPGAKQRFFVKNLFFFMVLRAHGRHIMAVPLVVFGGCLQDFLIETPVRSGDTTFDDRRTFRGESTLEDRRGAWAGESTFSSRRAGDLVPFEYFESEPAWFLELCLEALDSDPNELYIQ